jgi:hypothetical protein
MAQKKTKRGANPKQNKEQDPTRESNDHPPQINGYEINHGVALRFTCTAAVTNQAITWGNLLDTVLVATTAVQGFDLFDVVKVKSVSVWGQAALGTPSTVAVTFFSTTGDNQVHTDTSLGIKPAYVRARPSQKSLASFYSQASATQVLSLTCPAGSIIDVHLTFRTSPAAAVVAANALVGATVGELYFRGMDGLAIAGTNFPPPNGLPTR